jgi:hypothetical protein
MVDKLLFDEHEAAEMLGVSVCSACSKSSNGRQVKRCEKCGASLDPTGRKTLKFCSDSCRQKAYRRGSAVTDQEGERSRGPAGPVSVTPAQVDQALNEPQKRNMTAVRCEGCRREFQRPRKDAKFCSAACKQRVYRSGKIVAAGRCALEAAE